MAQLVFYPVYDNERHALRLDLVLWGSSKAFKWSQRRLQQFSGGLPRFDIREQEFFVLLGWVREIKVGLELFSDKGLYLRECLTSAEDYVESQTHHLDRREAHELACPLVPLLLTVLDRCTTQGDHKSCRSVANILTTMSGRMTDGINGVDFCPTPTSIRRPDEQALYAGQDFTRENEFQFQLGLQTRVHAKKSIDQYLARMTIDGLDEEETSTVENLVKWVEAGMFMSLVPLTPDLCPCEQCCACRAL
jgi:hypothetical protein